jgi:hypothetical protein
MVAEPDIFITRDEWLLSRFSSAPTFFKMMFEGVIKFI